jgi:hypothetical protein
MYRGIVSGGSAKLVASELKRADQQASWEGARAASRAAAEPASAEREATETVLPATGNATTRRPWWVLRALRLAH